jgi:hypothetical protein
LIEVTPDPPKDLVPRISQAVLPDLLREDGIRPLVTAVLHGSVDSPTVRYASQ